MKPSIWLVEDEASIADTLIYALQTEGFEVEWFARGLPLLEALNGRRPSLIILDIGLPDINGFDLCRQILTRDDRLPIIFLTARSEELDRILGLEMGADDYIPKPFSPREVVARVRALLRRIDKQQNSADSQTGPFQWNDCGHTITYFQQPLMLTRYEFLLLKTLLKAPERIYSRQQLMDLVWQDAEESLDRTVDTHIKTLRAKLRAVNDVCNPIRTHRGLGYSLSHHP